MRRLIGAVVVGLAIATSATAAPESVAVVKVAYNAKLHAKILVNGAGLTLYMYAGDYKTVSACTADFYKCPTLWPPLLTTGTPKAGSGAQRSLLRTAKRTNPSGTQVVYGGHLLYTWRGAGGSDPPPDKKPGDVNGQNYNHDWWVLSGSGVPIKKNAR